MTILKILASWAVLGVSMIIILILTEAYGRMKGYILHHPSLNINGNEYLTLLLSFLVGFIIACQIK